MNIYLSCTANLGDFVQSLPVLSGIARTYGPVNFFIRSEMRKFFGLIEFLKYQGIFNMVAFDDEPVRVTPPVLNLSSWTREHKNNPDRPTETCRYENWMKDNYKLDFEVDDDFVIKYPKADIEIQDNYYVGDRWSAPDIDDRREVEILSHLTDCVFLDYKKHDILTNCYIIKESVRPFITNFTGIGMIADLLDKECYVVWKAEDWKAEFRRGNDISWDNGKNIEQIFEKHFYKNRRARLVHASELPGLLK